MFLASSLWWRIIFSIDSPILELSRFGCLPLSRGPLAGGAEKLCMRDENFFRGLNR